MILWVISFVIVILFCIFSYFIAKYFDITLAILTVCMVLGMLYWMTCAVHSYLEGWL